jgi:F-type H+-transporting ATPase subunit gamma
MSKLIEIRRRIKSTKNIRQITKAMEMVSAVKLQHAQALLNINRNYIINLEETVRKIMTYKEDLLPIEPKNSLIIVVTPTKGFVGPLVLNLEKKVKELINNNKNKKFSIIGIEKKSLNFIFSLNIDILAQISLSSNNIENVYEISDIVIEEIKNKKIDEVYIIYNKFQNIISNEIIAEKMYPIDTKKEDFDSLYYVINKDPKAPAIYDIETHFEELYDNAINIYIPSKLQSCIIESDTSENAIRMITMRNSSDNAQELNKSLTFESNKIRQSNITQEVIEISSAANI